MFIKRIMQRYITIMFRYSYVEAWGLNSEIPNLDGIVIA